MDHLSRWVWVSKPWPFSSTCKNFKGQHQLGIVMWYFEKIDFGWVNMRAYNSFS